MTVAIPPHPNEEDPAAFEREVRAMVVDDAPRLFAVVSEETLECGLRDATILAWGLAYPDGEARVIREGRRVELMALPSAERAVRWFSLLDEGDIRLVWPGGGDGVAPDLPGL